MENIFKKAFRILELDERKGRWVKVEQDFHGNFQVNVTWVFCLFLRCPWLNRAHSGLVLKISSLCTSYRTRMSSTIETVDVPTGRRDMDLHRRLRGEWANNIINGDVTWSVRCTNQFQKPPIPSPGIPQAFDWSFAPYSGEFDPKWGLHPFMW